MRARRPRSWARSSKSSSGYGARSHARPGCRRTEAAIGCEISKATTGSTWPPWSTILTEAFTPARENGVPVFSSANVRHLSRMELPGGGQIVIQGRYAYVGHQHRPDGTTVLD